MNAHFEHWPAPAMHHLDAHRDETVKAFVILEPDFRGQTTAEELFAWSRGIVAVSKTPRLIDLVESLPKSGSGKVLWREPSDREDERTSGAN